MKKKRGGQNKHWAEKAKVWSWYREIRSRCDLSNHQLDYFFAWKEEAQPERTPDDRPRSFEFIENLARQSTRRDKKRLRDINEIVCAVGADRDFGFDGTKEIYFAQIWELFQKETIAPADLKKRMDEVLQENGLVRVDPLKPSPIAEMVAKFGNPKVFNACLSAALLTMDSFSRMALVWLLYLQTEPPSLWQYRAELLRLADGMFDNFFHHYFSEDLYLTYYSAALNALQSARLDTEGDTFNWAYQDFETTGSWPIFPRDMVDSVAEGDFFGLK